MGASDLGPRRVRAIARITGLPVTRAVVWCHVENGRTAVFFTEDGKRGELDRLTEQWRLYPDGGV